MVMSLVRPDAESGEPRVHGWIPRDAEDFRHLPPPPEPVWLGDGAGSDTGPSDEWTVDAPPGVVAHHVAAADLHRHLPPQPPADDAAPFAWVHRALCDGALVLRVEAPAHPTPIMLTHRARRTVGAPALRVDLADGAQVVLVEHHPGGLPDGVCNLQVHLHLGAGARLVHVRTVTPEAGERVAHHLQVRLGCGARYHQRLLARGAGYHLQRCVLDLDAPDAKADLAAVVLAGAGQCIEQQVRMGHAAVRTDGATASLALARDNAMVVLNARSLVAPGCDDAVLSQRLSAIPTAGQPRTVLRPHLDIRHDRVEARHGATWGTLPEEAIFMARQRGLDETTATALVLHGMAHALLAQGLPDDAVLASAGLPAWLDQQVRRHLFVGRGVQHE